MDFFIRRSRVAQSVCILFFLSTGCFGQSEARTNCLSYEPTVVKLSGTLIRKTFPGPPNYASVSRGDKPETYWLLNLPQPVCVDQDKTSADLNPAQKDVRVIQLVVPQKFYKKYKQLVGKKIIATGTLFGEFTGHHHTSVLLTVIDLTKAE